MWPKVVNPKGSPTISSKNCLENEKELRSQNGHFFFKCKSDGKVVLYRCD